MRRRDLKPYLEVIAELGAVVAGIEISKATHYKIRVRAGPHERLFIASFSPSDRRGLLNWRSDVRRWINNLSR